MILVLDGDTGEVIRFEILDFGLTPQINLEAYNIKDISVIIFAIIDGVNIMYFSSNVNG